METAAGTWSLVKETKAHVVVGFLLRLFLLGGSGRGRCVSCWSRRRRHCCKLGRVLEVLLSLVSLGKVDVGGDGDGQEVLEAVDDAEAEQTKEYLKDPSKFAAVAAAAAPAAEAAPAAAAAAKKEESEEESDDDMGFGLFD